MELQIAPAVAEVVALCVGAIEAQEKKGFLHHLLRLEVYAQLGVFPGHILGFK
jgi:hypothetical protein